MLVEMDIRLENNGFVTEDVKRKRNNRLHHVRSIRNCIKLRGI